jgi:hypothetical protein
LSRNIQVGCDNPILGAIQGIIGIEEVKVNGTYVGFTGPQMQRPSRKVDLSSEPPYILVFDRFYRKGCRIIIRKDLYMRPVLG